MDEGEFRAWSASVSNWQMSVLALRKDSQGRIRQQEALQWHSRRWWRTVCTSRTVNFVKIDSRGHFTILDPVIKDTWTIDSKDPQSRKIQVRKNLIQIVIMITEIPTKNDLRTEWCVFVLLESYIIRFSVVKSIFRLWYRYECLSRWSFCLYFGNVITRKVDFQLMKWHLNL